MIDLTGEEAEALKIDHIEEEVHSEVAHPEKKVKEDLTIEHHEVETTFEP